jgi:hypothetical protein
MDNKQKNYAQIELKHIQLELSNSRAQHMRHFIDQYFCYANGYVNKNGKAKWDAILWNENVSTKALELKSIGETTYKAVTKEHVVPLKYITKKLRELGPEATLNDIKQVIDLNLHFATITKEEDKALRDAKLGSVMPNEFYDPKSPLYQDVFARYKRVGIETRKING